MEKTVRQSLRRKRDEEKVTDLRTLGKDCEQGVKEAGDPCNKMTQR